MSSANPFTIPLPSVYIIPLIQRYVEHMGEDISAGAVLPIAVQQQAMSRTYQCIEFDLSDCLVSLICIVVIIAGSTLTYRHRRFCELLLPRVQFLTYNKLVFYRTRPPLRQKMIYCTLQMTFRYQKSYQGVSETSPSQSSVPGHLSCHTHSPILA
jgi:hypothetical protein